MDASPSAPTGSNGDGAATGGGVASGGAALAHPCTTTRDGSADGGGSGGLGPGPRARGDDAAGGGGAAGEAGGGEGLGAGAGAGVSGAPAGAQGADGGGDEDAAARAAKRVARKARKDAEHEARRLYNNLKRREKSKAVRLAKTAALKAQQDAALAAMTDEERAAWKAHMLARKLEREKAEAEQAARVDRAMAGEGHPLRIVVDCSFSPDAPPKELRSLCKQLENSQSVNRRYPAPCCFTLTSWGPRLQAVGAHMGAGGWRAHKLETGPVEAFGADKIVVLSPDATEPLTSVEPDTVYVVGGIVDRTHRKGLTLQFAEERQMVARRLAIPEHAEQLGLVKGVRKNPVLNIDDVVRALLVYNHTGDWVQALDAAIPMRKRKPQTMGFNPPKDRGVQGGGADGGEQQEEEEQGEEEGSAGEHGGQDARQKARELQAAARGLQGLSLEEGDGAASVVAAGGTAGAGAGQANGL